MYLQSLFLPWDEVNHARHQMKSKRGKESNLRSTRVARNFTHVVFRCLFAPASSFRTNSFLVTYLLCGREFSFPTRQNLTESGSVIAPPGESLHVQLSSGAIARESKISHTPYCDFSYGELRMFVHLQKIGGARMHRRFYAKREIVRDIENLVFGCDICFQFLFSFSVVHIRARIRSNVCSLFISLVEVAR